MKHFALAALAPLISAFALIAAPAIHAQTSAVAQYHFDEPAGSNTAVNSAVPDFDGTLSPGGSSFVPGGIVGNAISLDRAANGYVSMGNAFQFSGQDFSIVFWVKTTATANNTFAVSRHVAGANNVDTGPSRNGYYVALNATADGGLLDKATFTASDFDSESPTSTTSVNDGNWHQIVGVYVSGVVISTYVDGAPAETSRDPHALVANSSPPFLVGGVFQYHSPTGSPEGRYTGLIDELQIYSRALSDAEIDYLFQHPAEALPATFPEIAVEYPPANNFASGSTLAFGTVAAGTTADLTLVIRNTGNADLTLGNITFDGAPGPFRVLTPPAGVVTPSDSTSLTVRFSPTDAGFRTVMMHLANNDDDENPFVVKLTGTGDHLPEIAVEQPSGSGLTDGSARDFGNAASTLTFTIRNTGDADLTLGNLTIDGPAAAAFTVIASPSTPVTPAVPTEFTVQFAGSQGFSKATLHIANNDGDENPFELFLSGGTALDGPAAIDRLRVKLRQFANEKDSTEDTPVVLLPSTLNVRAEDLVYAVFELANADGFGDVTNAAALARAALEAIPVGVRLTIKSRTDKNTLAPRLLDAAMFGSGLIEVSDIVAILTALAKVNDTLPLAHQLTWVGKAALVGRALQLTNDWDPAAGAAIATVARELSASAKGATTNEKLQVFTIIALTRTESAGQVGSFMQKMLEFVTGDDALKDAFARAVAAGVVLEDRVIAGEVIGGRAAQLTGDAAIKALTLSAIGDTGLARAIGPIVAATTEHLSGDPAQFAADLIAAVPIDQRTISLRGAIASGVLQNVTGAEAGNVIDKALNGPVPSSADLYRFANAAAVGTGDVAGDVVTKLVSFVNEPIPDKDLFARTNIGVGALKAIALSSPSSAAVIAQRLIDSSPAAFGTDAAKTFLAVQLAKAVPNQGPAAGAAVAGVARKLSARTVDTLALLTRDTVRAAPGAALDIARELSALLPASDYVAFAQAAALQLLSNAPSIAAGVAITAVADATVTNGQVTGGHTAGDIAAAVTLAGLTGALQSKAVVIAGAVARAVDEESVADVGAVVSALLGTGGKLPHLSSIGPLGTSLTTAINARPLVPTRNRVEEIGELAAELTRQAIVRLGPDSPTTLRASTIGSIFSSMKNGLGPLLVNGGGFAADRKDATGEIAGAIAQTISIVVLENRLTAQQATDLLAAPSGPADRKSLEYLLITSARPYGGKVTAAFAEVRAAALADPLGRIVPGTRTISNASTGGTITTTQGKYEIGSVIDPITPFPQLP